MKKIKQFLQNSKKAGNYNRSFSGIILILSLCVYGLGCGDETFNDDVDTEPPTGGFVINYGLDSTYSRSVTLKIDVREAVQMRFSNDQLAWTDWEELSDTKKEWPLENEPGTRTVYGQFRDAAGNVAKFKDSIIFEDLQEAQFLVNSGSDYTFSSTVTLKLNLPGTSEMRFSNDVNKWNEDWETYSQKKPWALEIGPGAKTVYVELRDSSGSITRENCSITLVDSSSCKFIINNDISGTFSQSVIIGMDVPGAVNMRLRDDGISWLNPEGYDSNKNWDLSFGFGERTVYGEFYDSEGNDLLLSDTVTLNDKESCSIEIKNNESIRFSRSVVIDVTSPGASHMRFCNDGLSWPAWESCSSSKNWVLPVGSGVKTVYVQFTDSRRNTFEKSTTVPFTDASECSFVINNDDYYADSYSVILTINVPGAITMRFKDTDSGWEGWQDYSSTKMFGLTQFHGQNKTLLAEFRDYAGNIISKEDSIYIRQ
ncbi:MAG: hypothetical protein GY754_42310 [bacterium]|nr:hypothetical protein [bacterium]